MAGVTGFPFKPVLSRTVSTPSSSNPCTCRAHLIFKNPNPFGLNDCRSSVSFRRRPVAVTARYGGFRSGQSDSRRSRESRKVDYGADPALDMSTISSPSVRLIDGQQNMVGVVSKSEAIRMAEDAELDLVILSPDADPPVLKIMDYNKYRYEQQKKKRDQQKKSTATRMDMKELKMGFNIDSHDYSVRLRAAQKFLKDGDKVKIIVSLKGRENEFRNIAIELIKRFQNDVGELGTEESKSFSERNIFIVLIPNKTVQQKAATGPSKKKEQSVSEISALTNP